MQGTQSKRNLAGWLAVFFIIALGAKLWTIQLWATNLPYWDQWDEARLFFKPWLDGTLSWHDFFIPHNEHRIFFTRLLDLFEVKLNGQWDPFFQMVVNAVIHIGYGWLLAAVIWGFTGRRHAGLICCALLPLFALPFAAENTTHGFQSQMYLVNLFSVVAILGLGFSRPGGRRWLGGFAVAVLAIFTIASGFLAALAVAGLVALRALKQRRLTREQILTILTGAIVVALGLGLKVTVARHQVLQAHSLNDFLSALAGYLAWPFNLQPAMAFLMCLPLALLAARYFQSGENSPAAEFVLVFGLWGLLQVAALAFGRALLPDASRYCDTLSTLPAAGLAALFVLAGDAGFRKTLGKMAMPAAVLWSLILLAGLGQNSHALMGKYLLWSRQWGLMQTENVRAFIATDEAGWLVNKNEEAIPYWNSNSLITLLRDPKFLSIMPADARPPLRLEPDGALTTGFFPNGCPPERPGQPFTRVWGNSPTNGPATAGRFVSRPMSATLPRLSLQVYQAAAGARIRLAGADGRTVELHPNFTGRWETLIVDAPRPPFVLSVENTAAGAPVAVGVIKELGTWSVFAQHLINHAVLVLSAGLGLCVALALAGFTRPGVALVNTGLGWLAILLVSLTALAGAYCWRNYDATEYTFECQTMWAADIASGGNLDLAALYLREALWLRPDDAEARKALATLQAHSLKGPQRKPTP